MCYLNAIGPGMTKAEFLEVTPYRPEGCTGWGYAWVVDGEFFVRKGHGGFTDEAWDAFLDHLPHPGWTLIQYRGGGAYTNDDNLHPWVHGDWCLAGQGGTSYRVGTKYDKACKGNVDTERHAAYLGMYGLQKTVDANMSGSSIALGRTGRLFCASISTIQKHKGKMIRYGTREDPVMRIYTAYSYGPAIIYPSGFVRKLHRKDLSCAPGSE